MTVYLVISLPYDTKYIRLAQNHTYTVYIYSSGQPYKYTPYIYMVLANPNSIVRAACQGIWKSPNLSSSAPNYLIQLG